MSAKLLQGRPVAQRLRAEIKARATRVAELRGSAPHLAVLSIGGDAASQLYLRNKLQACKESGVESTVEALHERITETEVLRVLQEWGQDPAVDGIILELPVPRHLDSGRLIDAISPDRDAEGVTRANFGRFYSAKSLHQLKSSDALVPCTASAVITLLQETDVKPAGLNAVVIGRSNIVGKPSAHLLSCLDATVTLAHSRTKDLAEHVRRADILVAAAGRRGLVKGEWVKPGAVVLDAGVSGGKDDMGGDVEFEAASARAAYITPVPGGVGPLTVTFLLHNTVLSAERRAHSL